MRKILRISRIKLKKMRRKITLLLLLGYAFLIVGIVMIFKLDILLLGFLFAIIGFVLEEIDRKQKRNK